LTSTENVQLWYSSKDESGFTIFVEPDSGFEGYINWIATKINTENVRDINIIESSIPNLNISFVAENTGGANKDLILTWELIRTDNEEMLDSGGETKLVPANSEIVFAILTITRRIITIKVIFKERSSFLYLLSFHFNRFLKN
jgi:hypothetical protein